MRAATLSPAEIVLRRSWTHGLSDHASMGPQLYRCGNHVRNNTNLIPPIASMGPQLYRCGNSTFSCLGLQVGLLASMGPQLYRCGNCQIIGMQCILFRSLQWGRNFIVAERCQQSRAAALLWSFNGAATVSLRKYAGHVCQDVLRSQTSMGPQLYRCGNRPDAIRNPG